jgi:uncharacterized membrane protein
LLGLLSAATVFARIRQVRPALAVLLDFLLAAGLLRLSRDATWAALATAALVVAIRKLVMTAGLHPHAAR